MVMENLLQDIVSDLTADSSAGSAARARLGNGVAVIEAVHGSARILRQGITNPTALIMTRY